MSVVAHGTKPDLLRPPRDGVPRDGGRMSGADRCTQPASRAGEGPHSMRRAGAQADAKPCPGCGDEEKQAEKWSQANMSMHTMRMSWT